MKQIIENLLCSAIEGGSNYWYMIEDHNAKELGVTYVSELLLHPDAKMVISDSSGEECFEPVTVTHDDIKKAWTLFKTDNQYEHHYKDAIRENDDACTGDVFFQLVVFKDVIFG